MVMGKNDVAWENIFAKYNILEIIKNIGYYKITADEIKEFREPRLMTKFDSTSDLPKIFRENELAILPTKRGDYVIGKFKNYQEIDIDNSVDVKTMYLPDYITTIDYKNITSESISLMASLVSGMLEDLLGEEVVPTISGRMKSGCFNYKVKTINGNCVDIKVENSQMEIDGGYEGGEKIAIVEAKNHYMSDFIVRQLYYPYRSLKSKTEKEVVPIMLIKHDNIFNFYVYEFLDDVNYNSIKLVDIKRYILGEVYQSIEIDDIVNVFNNIKLVKEDDKIPFPQADSFYRVIDFINTLNDSELSIEEITELYDFDERQSRYYSSAARYLGFVIKEKGKYKLSKYGLKLMQMNHKEKNLKIVEAIIKHKPFYVAMSMYLADGSFDYEKIANVILEESVNVNSLETAYRRAQSVVSWIRWIINLTTVYENNPFDK